MDSVSGSVTSGYVLPISVHAATCRPNPHRSGDSRWPRLGPRRLAVRERREFAEHASIGTATWYRTVDGAIDRCQSGVKAHPERERPYRN